MDFHRPPFNDPDAVAVQQTIRHKAQLGADEAILVMLDQSLMGEGAKGWVLTDKRLVHYARKITFDAPLPALSITFNPSSDFVRAEDFFTGRIVFQASGQEETEKFGMGTNAEVLGFLSEIAQAAGLEITGLDLALNAAGVDADDLRRTEEDLAEQGSVNPIHWMRSKVTSPAYLTLIEGVLHPGETPLADSLPQKGDIDRTLITDQRLLKLDSKGKLLESIPLNQVGMISSVIAFGRIQIEDLRKGEFLPSGGTTDPTALGKLVVAACRGELPAPIPETDLSDLPTPAIRCGQGFVEIPLEAPWLLVKETAASSKLGFIKSQRTLTTVLKCEVPVAGPCAWGGGGQPVGTRVTQIAGPLQPLKEFDKVLAAAEVLGKAGRALVFGPFAAVTEGNVGLTDFYHQYQVIWNLPIADPDRPATDAPKIRLVGLRRNGEYLRFDIEDPGLAEAFMVMYGS